MHLIRVVLSIAVHCCLALGQPGLGQHWSPRPRGLGTRFSGPQNSETQYQRWEQEQENYI